MHVILSNTPIVFISRLVINHQIRNWIYLGKDLRVHKKFSALLKNRCQEIQYSKELYKISFHQQRNFVQWIDKISGAFQQNKDWFFSAAAIKNPYTSDLFLNYCYFFVVEHFEIQKKNEIDLIIVDSPALAEVIKEYFPRNIKYLKLHFVFSLFLKLKIIIKSVLRYLRYSLDFCIRIFWARIILKTNKDWTKDSNIIFIRNFISQDYRGKDDKVFENHFFPGLYEFLIHKNFSPVFLPATVPLNIFEYKNSYQRIADLDRKVIVPEQLLKLSDLLYALLTPLRGMCIKFPEVQCGQYDLMGLVKEDYTVNRTEFGVLYANLLNRFGKRLASIHLKPLAIINWSENQSLEKGLLSGLKEQFRELKIFASQAFIPSSNHLSLVFSQQDKILNLLPDRLIVLGELERKLAESFVQINVKYGPLFRYSKVFDLNQAQNKQNGDLLVIMGFGYGIALKVIDILINIIEKLSMFDKIIIKLHPASYFTLDKMLKELNVLDLPDKFKIVKGEINQYLSCTSLALCTAGTGAAVEIISKGIPIIIVGEERALTLNVLSEKEDGHLWRLAFNKEDILDAINILINQEKEAIYKKSHNFRKLFFAEPNDQYWENYLPF